MDVLKGFKESCVGVMMEVEVRGKCFGSRWEVKKGRYKDRGGVDIDNLIYLVVKGSERIEF